MKQSMPEMTRIPDRRRARRLVVSLTVFWLVWGLLVGAMVTGRSGAVFGVGFAAAMASMGCFYWTFLDVWRDVLQAPAWRVLLLPSVRRARLTNRLMRNLYRPSWLWSTLRATEWSPMVLAAGLLTLLVADLVLFVVMMGHSYPR